MKEENMPSYWRTSRKKTVIFAIIPFVILIAMIAFLFSPIGQSVLNTGIQVPNLSIEKVEFQEGKIVTYIRNTGPMEVTVAQADINDRIYSAAIEPGRTLSKLSQAKVIIPFPWNKGEPYDVGITTSDGIRFSKKVEVAAPAPNPNIQQASMFAIIGTYVGIIPVVIGLLWFPFVRRLSANKYNFFLSLTTGLLVFLGIDALLEANEIATKNLAAIFNGQILIVVVTIVSFLGLYYVSDRLIHRAEKKSVSNISTSYVSSENSSSSSGSRTTQQQEELIKPLAISLMIAIGIGLHNFGEGLAIGAAVLLGQVAFSTFLIVGFTLHNTTEGLAIVAPMAKSGKVSIRRLAFMGLIAGAPTIAGAWMGGFLYSPIASIVFLSIGAGAIFQVVYAIISWMSHTSSNRKALMNGHIIAGFAVGMLIMYVTGLLV